MSVARLSSCVLILALCAVNRAGAQDVVTTTPPVAGTVQVLPLPTTDPRLFPVPPERLSRSAPAQAMVIPGTQHDHIVVGAIIGAAVGVAFAFIVQPRCDADRTGTGPACPSYKLPAVLLLGTGGGLIGELLGAALPHDP